MRACNLKFGHFRGADDRFFVVCHGERKLAWSRLKAGRGQNCPPSSVPQPVFIAIGGPPTLFAFLQIYVKRSALSTHYSIGVNRRRESGEGLRMRVQRGNPLFQKQLRAEVRRILLLLERTRRTRQQARLAIALETGVSPRRAGARAGGVARPVPYRPILPGAPIDG